MTTTATSLLAFPPTGADRTATAAPFPGNRIHFLEIQGNSPGQEGGEGVQHFPIQKVAILPLRLLEPHRVLRVRNVCVEGAVYLASWQP